MLSRIIYFVGATMAMGATWLFSLVYLAQSCCALAIEGQILVGASIGSFFVAAIAAWKLFINPRKRV